MRKICVVLFVIFDIILSCLAFSSGVVKLSIDTDNSFNINEITKYKDRINNIGGVCYGIDAMRQLPITIRSNDSVGITSEIRVILRYSKNALRNSWIKYKGYYLQEYDLLPEDMVLIPSVISNNAINNGYVGSGDDRINLDIDVYTSNRESNSSFHRIPIAYGSEETFVKIYNELFETDKMDIEEILPNHLETIIQYNNKFHLLLIINSIFSKNLHVSWEGRIIDVTFIIVYCLFNISAVSYVIYKCISKQKNNN